MISLTTSELIEILDCTPAEQNIMLAGRHGIGKSEILTEYYTKKNFRVVSLFLGQMSDPGDIIGLPSKNETTGQTEFMLPYWFPVDGKPVVLFLDELNRARPEILQTIMDLALNRKLAGKKLPEGSRLISAVNDGDEYQLTDLDPALVSRFNIYSFKPTVEEWLLWASRNKLDSRVINFIQANPEFLDSAVVAEKFDTGLEKTPDRRAWKKVSDILKPKKKLSEVHKKLVAGIVGTPAAVKFFDFASGKQILPAKDILMNFSKSKSVVEKYEIHQLSQLNDSVFRFLQTSQLSENEENTVAENLLLYFKLLEKNNQKEAIAHFASYFEKTDYPKAISFIMMDVSEVYSKIMDFIDNI